MRHTRRRQFLLGLTTAGVSGIAGCAAALEPEMEFKSFLVPKPNPVSIDADGNEYATTIHNSGDRGSIRTELWYLRDQTVSTPNVPHKFQDDYSAGREFDVGRSFYFSSGERREVSFGATKEQPTWSQGDYGITVFPASHGAVFENTGSAGEIEARLEYRNTQGYDVEVPSKKLESVGEGERIEFTFDVLIPKGVEYEIVAEQA